MRYAHYVEMMISAGHVFCEVVKNEDLEKTEKGKNMEQIVMLFNETKTKKKITISKQH